MCSRSINLIMGLLIFNFIKHLQITLQSVSTQHFYQQYMRIYDPPYGHLLIVLSDLLLPFKCVLNNISWFLNSHLSEYYCNCGFFHNIRFLVPISVNSNILLIFYWVDFFVCTVWKIYFYISLITPSTSKIDMRQINIKTEK